MILNPPEQTAEKCVLEKILQCEMHIPAEKCLFPGYRGNFSSFMSNSKTFKSVSVSVRK